MCARSYPDREATNSMPSIAPPSGSNKFGRTEIGELSKVGAENNSLNYLPEAR